MGRWTLGGIAVGLLSGAVAAPRFAQQATTESAVPSDEVFLTAYRQANPLVDWPLKTLLHHIPELRHLKPSADQSALPQILARVGENSRLFVANSLNTTSVETIDQSRTFGPTLTRRVTVTVTRKFHYLMVVKADPRPGFSALDEYRTGLRGGRRGYETGSQGFFATKGFASMPLAFSLQTQPHSTFRYLGTEVVGKRRLEVVAFSNHAERSGVMGVFIDGGLRVPLLIQGVAWIDPANYQIEQMRTDLLAPQPSIQLEGITTKVQFQAVNFRTAGSVLWLPKEVNVTVYWGEITYSNRHRYKNYQLFRVDTRQDLEAPKPPSGP
ncbi:MAG TPA: hypothetical protein VL523_03025 [Terriglobia bacterium]|nr:hypothetical protein [Terriglobia bacterium]